MEESSEKASGNNRRYSIDELICLRTSAPFVLLNLDNLATEAETSSILNLPQQAKENPDFCIRTSELAKMSKRASLVERPGNNSTRNRAASRSLMASGFDEDEDRVLYRGHPMRRDIRETQWQLRRRGASDRSSQPVDAPTEILAQKDDNFKAFFQAVRSPTHVRVTAGGRIVPNTRAHPPPQPVFKWNNEQHFFEHPKRQSSPDNGQTSFYQEGVNLLQTDQRLYAGFPAAGPPYFDGTAAIHPSGTAGDNNATENIPMQSSKSAPATTEATSINSHPITSHQGIQISPPENFDLTRPYWFHDRWIFPHGLEPSQHQHMLPVNLAGNAGMLHPMYGYLPGAFGPQVPPPGMFFPPPNHAMGMHQPGQQLPYAIPIMYPGPQPLGNIANGVPVQPAASGAPLFAPQLLQYVEDPKQRLARCREDLKKIENDLENNVHQIDKPSKLVQRSLCVAEIQRLEALLNHNATKQDSIAAGSGMLPKDSLRKISSIVPKDETSDRNIKKPSVVDSSLATSNAALTNNGPKSTELSAEQELKDGSREKSKVDPRVEASAVQDRSRSRARLAAAAATAVFQPRSQISEPKDNGAANTGISDPGQDERAKEKLEEARLIAHALDWSVPAGMLNRTNLGHPVPYSHVAPSRARHNETTGIQKVYPYMAAGAHVPSHVPAHVPVAPRAMPTHIAATPYLRGIQLLGNGEYTYERQLTDDELRARCLYWGKASRELQSGLPKYNGRDFFPPSPVKAPSRSMEVAGRAQLSDPFRDMDYSRANQGLRDNGNEEDNSSVGSWGDVVKSKIKSKDLPPAHTLPRMRAVKRDDQNRFTAKANVPLEEDQSTVASDKQSIGAEKRSFVESKVSSSSFLQDMLKNPRYTSSFDRKEPSSDSFSANSQSFEDKARMTTPLSGASMAAVLSGTITSATAKGLLPQYRGSATASLAPNSGSPDRFGSKLFARFSSTSDTQEQSPPKALRNEENRAAPSRLAAAEYLRTLANKEQREDQKASSTFADSLVSKHNNNTGGDY